MEMTLRGQGRVRVASSRAVGFFVLAALALGNAYQAGAGSRVIPEVSGESRDFVALKRTAPPALSPENRFMAGYYHPLALRLTFSPTQAGPDGSLALPDRRWFQSQMAFSIQIGDEKRPLVPEARGASLHVVCQPGKIREEWSWPDGLTLTRVCFQPSNFPAVGIRCSLRNTGTRVQSGLRLEAKLGNPEIMEGRPYPGIGFSDEADDELITDPRSGTLFQHDWINREATWLVFGWSPEGGPIAAGSDEVFNQAGMPNLSVLLETPALDLLPEQTTAPILWVVWGNDRETVARNLEKLRKYSGFSHWEEDVRKARQAGMEFSCQDPYLVYLFHSLKTWAVWSGRSDHQDQSGLMGIADTAWMLPQKASAGMTAWSTFVKSDILKSYLSYWLDQKTPTPNSAHALLMAGLYYHQTGDRKWLEENASRVREMLIYLKALDQDHDTLPDFIYPWDEGVHSLFGNQADAGQLQTAEAQLAAARAFGLGADLLEAMNAGAEEVSHWREQSESVRTAFHTHYWEPQVGNRGFYAYGRAAGHGVVDRHRDAGAVEAVLHGIGTSEALGAVFEELWTNPGWRTPKGRYRLLPTGEPSYKIKMEDGDAPLLSHRRTHQVLLAGLKQDTTATEALSRLSFYAKEVVLDPKLMAHPGAVLDRPSEWEVGSMNLLDVLVEGLCGLEQEARGLRVRIPAYAQDFGAEIRQMPYRGALVTVRVKGPGGGQGRITVNGRPLAPGALIPAEAFSQGRVSIRIDRELKKQPSRIQKRRPAVLRKKR